MLAAVFLAGFFAMGSSSESGQSEGRSDGVRARFLPLSTALGAGVGGVVSFEIGDCSSSSSSLVRMATGLEGLCSVSSVHGRLASSALRDEAAAI